MHKLTLGGLGLVVLKVVVLLGIALANLGCFASLAEQYPHATIYTICVHMPGMAPETNHWVYSEYGEAISDGHPDEFDQRARVAERIFVFSKNAPSKNLLLLPNPHNQLTCSSAFLPANLFEDERRCSQRRTVGVFGQVIDVKSGWFCGARPVVADPAQLSHDNVKNRAIEIGRMLGQLLGDATAGPDMLVGAQRDAFRRQLQQPEFLNHYQKSFAEKLNAIPDLPTYDDPALARTALEGFEAGFGEGLDSARTKALAVNLAAHAALALSGNAAGALETIGAKALSAALARLRTMPLFIPGTTTGIGFFLRIPKPPPANANAPSLPPGAVAPPVTAPPPFGNLSRAAEFGVKSYNKMLNALKGTGLKAHHLIEQRLGPFMGGDARMNLTVAVTDAEHQIFTNSWRSRIPYGSTPTPELITKMAREIYADYPAILKALGL